MKCFYCDRKVKLIDFGDCCYKGLCDCGAEVEYVHDPQDGSGSTTWMPPSGPVGSYGEHPDDD